MKSALVVLLAVTACCLAAPKARDITDFVELSPAFRNNGASASSLDWRQRGVISPVQNQPRNTSGSVLFVMETVQSLHAIQTGQILNLSVTQVLDCLGHGQTVNSFEIMAYIGGLCTEASYHVRHNTCKAGECPVVAPVTSSSRIFNLQEMEAAILKRPLMVFVDGSQQSFKSYTGGIYEDSKCSQSFTTNALQVVGFGTESGKDFWICKNNWGTNWGENGYIRFLKGVNMCSIEQTGQYPI